MKIIASLCHLIRSRLTLLPLVGLAACALSHSACGQALLSFSGGSGAPLAITLSRPVTFTITSSGAGPYFDFQGVGNAFSSGPGVSGSGGSITFQINSGSQLALTSTLSGVSDGSFSSADLLLYGSSNSLSVGQIVTLRAGTLTTSGNFAGLAPAGGSFTTFIGDQFGNRLSANGVSAAPEPSPWALLGVSTAGAGVVALRRRWSHA